MPYFTQSFIKGMNTDTDVSSLPEGTYRSARNFTFTTIENGTSGALENVKGNTLWKTLSYDIVGYINIVRDIVFFCYDEAANTSEIRVYTAETGNITLLYTDVTGCVVDGSKLNFSNLPERRIVGVGRYESENIRKIYWTDGVEEVRTANLDTVYLENPDLPPNCSSNEYTSVDKFSLLPNVNLGNI